MSVALDNPVKLFYGVDNETSVGGCFWWFEVSSEYLHILPRVLPYLGRVHWQEFFSLFCRERTKLGTIGVLLRYFLTLSKRFVVRIVPTITSKATARVTMRLRESLLCYLN